MNVTNVNKNNLSFLTELPIPSTEAIQIIESIKPDLQSVQFLKENHSTIRDFKTVKEMLQETRDHSVRNKALACAATAAGVTSLALIILGIALIGSPAAAGLLAGGGASYAIYSMFAGGISKYRIEETVEAAEKLEAPGICTKVARELLFSGYTPPLGMLCGLTAAAPAYEAFTREGRLETSSEILEQHLLTHLKNVTAEDIRELANSDLKKHLKEKIEEIEQKIDELNRNPCSTRHSSPLLAHYQSALTFVQAAAKFESSAPTQKISV